MIAHIDRLGFIVPKANTLYIPEDWVGYVSTENQQLNLIYFKIHSEFFWPPCILILGAFQERSRASSHTVNINGSKYLHTNSITFDVYGTGQTSS